jgi:hypothetical protein
LLNSQVEHSGGMHVIACVLTAADGAPNRQITDARDMRLWVPR